MTICDTGPLVAIIDAKDANHLRCLEAAKKVRLPLITSIACLTEALYLLGKSAGYSGQEALWEFSRQGLLAFDHSAPAEIEEAYDFMERFRDVPCDFADATLLVLLRKLGKTTILTLDGHFHAYRILGKSLEVFPGPRP